MHRCLQSDDVPILPQGTGRAETTPAVDVVLCYLKDEVRQLVHDVTDQNFKSHVLEAQGPVLVDFWAPWCGPCRMIAPIVEQLAEEWAGRLTVMRQNVDENPDTAAHYGVMSIPLLALFEGGDLKQRWVGYRPKQQLVRDLEAAVAKK